ncbi:MAG TPA: S41 family peptidase [Cyclobacteriaceae bacterium]
MKKGRKRLALVLVSTIALVAFVAPPAEKYFEIAKSLDIFSTLFKEVNAYYVDEVDPKKLIDQGINGMLENLDPYTVYISEDEQESFSIQTTGQYAGIGALIGIINNKTVVTHPYLGFPAYRAGVKVGDEFISVDGQNMRGKPSSAVSAALKGKPKTEVEIVLHRPGLKDDIRFKILRERIKITNVVYSGMIDATTGYIKLDDFTPGAGKEVEESVIRLKNSGARKLVLDLRDNPGGLLYEAINIVNIFIPKSKEVVSTKGKAAEWNKTYVTLNEPVDTEIPLAILTSGGSASAAEIVAGSLQDYDRAVLIGEKTFGKGLVQTTRPLAYNAQLKVTTAKYYIPSGRCIQALDYTHREKDGTVNRVADSLKVAFKTAHGRKVFDGGGLDPDIKVEPETFGSAASELLTSGLMFEYASTYCAENTAPASLKGFRLSDADYAKFVTWIKTQKFEYTDALEKRADDLIAAAKTEKYYNELSSSLTDLKNKIIASRENDFTKFRKEISELLEMEIAFHYALNAGQAEASVDRDPDVLQAVKVLGDQVRYKNMLIPQ